MGNCPLLFMLSKIIKLAQLFEKLASKTLYHGTCIKNIPSIKQHGLIPQVRHWVSDSYGCEIDLDEDSEEYSGLSEENRPKFDITFATDKEELSKALGAAIAAVAGYLKKSFHDVTDEEIRALGAIVIMYDAEEAWEHKPEEDPHGQWEYENQGYVTVEPGDYFSERCQSIDNVLTGEPMIRLLRQYGVWPRDWGPDKLKNQKELLLKHFVPIYKNRQKELIEKMNELNDDEINKLYYKVYKNYG